MAPDDDDKPGGPFQGLPRPEHVRARAEAANLPPPTRSRDSDYGDDKAPDSGPPEPEMRRAPRRQQDDRRPVVPDAPSPPPRTGLLTPGQRYEGRMATGLGFEGLAAALGFSPKNGERSIRRWEQENPEPDPDDRPPPRSVELLLLLAAEIPEVAAFLREQGRGAPDAHFRSHFRNLR